MGANMSLLAQVFFTHECTWGLDTAEEQEILPLYEWVFWYSRMPHGLILQADLLQFIGRLPPAIFTYALCGLMYFAQTCIQIASFFMTYVTFNPGQLWLWAAGLFLTSNHLLDLVSQAKAHPQDLLTSLLTHSLLLALIIKISWRVDSFPHQPSCARSDNNQHPKPLHEMSIACDSFKFNQSCLPFQCRHRTRGIPIHKWQGARWIEMIGS